MGPGPFDRLTVRLATGPVGRGAAFAIDLAAALLRTARGDPRHPEERPANHHAPSNVPE